MRLFLQLLNYLFVSNFQSGEPKFGYLLRQCGFSSKPVDEIAPEGADVHLRYHSFLQHVSFLAVTEYASADLINVVVMIFYLNLEARKAFQKDLHFQVWQRNFYYCFLQLIITEQWVEEELARDGRRTCCLSKSSLQSWLKFSS